MDDFSRSLQKHLQNVVGGVTQNSPLGDVNPLVTIGLTESILELGLSEQQMYLVIRGYARQLLLQVHPDMTKSNISGDRQLHIIQAFKILEDKDSFSLALREFRNLKADDRRESRILSQALNATRTRLTEYELATNRFEKAKEELAREISEFERVKREDPLKTPELEKTISGLRGQLETLEQMLSRSKAVSADWKRKHEYSTRYFASMGESNAETHEGVFAFNAKWIAVASLWNLGSSLDCSPFEGDNKTIRPEIKKQARGMGVSKKSLANAVAAWRDAVKNFGTPERTESKQLPMGFSIIMLDHGIPTSVIGDKAVAQGGRVIGSIQPDKITISRRHFTKAMGHETIFETLSPYLRVGGLLVSFQTIKGRKVSWSNICPAFRAKSNRLILALG